MDTPKKRYWHGLCIGLVIGAGVILCAVFVSQLNLFPLAALCNKDEGVGSCIREWLNAVAGIAAVITILLLLREQAFTREVAILQTLDTRSRFVTGLQVARRLRSLAEQIRQSGFRWENPRGGRRPPIQPAYLVSNLLEIERLLLDEVWNTATNFDDRVMRNRAALVPIVADLLNTFLAGNLNFARQPQNRVTAAMIQEHWQQDINSGEIIQLSYRLENLGNRVQRLAEELSNFRGTRYFHQPDEANERET